MIGALEYVNCIGATTVAISCTKQAKIFQYAKYHIETVPGPEVLTGSTRLKAGTTQKVILNMISTLSMVSVGKVYQNLMVDVKPTNQKLIERSKNIICEATGVNYATATRIYTLFTATRGYVSGCFPRGVYLILWEKLPIS